MVLCLASRERCVSSKASILFVTCQRMEIIIIGKKKQPKRCFKSRCCFAFEWQTPQKSNFIPITAVTSWPKRSRQITTGVHSRLFFPLPVSDLKKAQITATKSNLGPLACLVLRLWHAGTYLRSSSELDSSTPRAPNPQWTLRRSACHRLSRRSLSIPPVRIWIPSHCLPRLKPCGSFLSRLEIRPPQLQTAGMKA